MTGHKRIAVVGAGLGGLTAAGFLQRAGFAVKVYEQAPAFSRIGAGIILSANVTKVLRRLGLEEGLIAAGIKSQSYVSRAWDTGETMAEFVFDAEAERRYGGPYVHIHRGDQSLFEAEPAEHLGDVGGQNDAGTDARERRRLLVDLHREPRALQKAGRSQAAEAGADDCDPLCLLHRSM